jgi:hypothetical protein
MERANSSGCGWGKSSGCGWGKSSGCGWGCNMTLAFIDTLVYGFIVYGFIAVVRRVRRAFVGGADEYAV